MQKCKNAKVQKCSVLTFSYPNNFSTHPLACFIENDDCDVARIAKLDKINIFLPKDLEIWNEYITFAA